MKKIFFILIIMIATSCKTHDKVYTNGSHENILFTHNNLLIYSRSLGCIGGSNKVFYVKRGDTIIVEKQSVAIRPETSLHVDDNLYGQRFKMYKDSLVNIDKGVNFYSPRYVKNQEKKAVFYFILNGEKYRISKKNAEKSIIYKLKTEEYLVTPIDKETAYKKYDINRKYKTLELKRK